MQPAPAESAFYAIVVGRRRNVDRAIRGGRVLPRCFA